MARLDDHLIRLPLLRDRATRKRVVRLRRELFERAGSARYSRTALHGLDAKLAPWLGDAPGVFVEAGANDGVTQSNTYYLERFRGWRGLLVEAVPELAAEAAAQRPASRVVACALVADSTATPTVTMAVDDLTSAVADRGVPVPARTLTEVLDEAGIERVDFLSLDVEGHEAEVLRGLDLARHAPRLVLVEILEPGRRAGIEAVLGPRYAAVAEPTPTDVLYRWTAPR